MTYLYYNLLYLLETVVEEKKDNWFISFLKSIWEEITDMFGDVIDFFKSIYNGLSSKFGETAVIVIFAMIAIVGVMVIATAIIRK